MEVRVVDAKDRRRVIKQPFSTHGNRMIQFVMHSLGFMVMNDGLIKSIHVVSM